jgi:N-acetylmuramoyl-L-alanine amidase
VTLATIKQLFLYILAWLILASCASDGKFVQVPSDNQNSRVKMIVLHHTTVDFAESLDVLTKSTVGSVSAHYLIPEPGDPTYTKKKLKVHQLVADTGRAWHAGVSYWRGKSGLNDQSIGIELVYKTHCSDWVEAGEGDTRSVPERLCLYPDFAETQIELLVDLLGGLKKKHPDIASIDIVGHSDIAPSRKTDPGPRFPWQRLYKLGFGAWPDAETVSKYWTRFQSDPLPLTSIQRALGAYGYEIEVTGELDRQTRHVLRAFQMHFVPSKVTKEPDAETAAVLFALIEKYHYSALSCLLAVSSSQNEKED